nr:thioesterase family protein [uncultured Desulfuromonas sp.]
MVAKINDVIVRYAETDAQGVVHHATYPIWFEEGRSSFLRQIGSPYSEWEKMGYFVVVADLSVRYLAPAFYEDQLTVETSLQRLKKRLIEFSYRILRDDELIVQGSSRHLIVGPDKQPRALETSFFDRLNQLLATQEVE